MGVVPTSAFDPLFWAHHANVDRLFAMWQQNNPDVVPPPDIYNTVLSPFNVTVKQMWNPEPQNLGYDYVASIEEHPLLAGLLAAKRALTGQDAFSTPLLSVSKDDLGPNFQRVQLRLSGPEHTERGYVVLVFVNQDDATVETQTVGNPHFAAAIPLLAHGPCLGQDANHCDPAASPRGKFDIRSPHHLTPFEEYADITSAVNSALARGEDNIRVKLLVTDFEGNAVVSNDISAKVISLVST